MRKRLLLILLCVATVLCLAGCNAAPEEYEEYFYKINKLIQHEDFCTAEVKPGKIVPVRSTFTL